MNPDDSAFSAPAYTDIKEGRGSARSHDVIRGLTKREYIAAMAMQGLLSNPDYMTLYNKEKYIMQSEIIAKVATEQADELIKYLNKK